MYVDSLIALCSTSYAQIKHTINKCFENVCPVIGNVGMSLLFQTIIRDDTLYLKEDPEDAGEDEAEIEADEANEETEEEGQSEEIEGEEEMLNKRKPAKSVAEVAKKDKGLEGTSNGQSKAKKNKLKESN